MNMTLGKLFGDKAKNFADLEFPSHLATDSRDVKQGSAFIAIEGEKVDGHNYIPQAIENGAALIIARTGKAPENLNIPVIELDNPEKDLAGVAAKKLAAHELQEVIGVTGSVGKTTTRAALQKVLSSRFKVHAPVRSFNTLIGCTATIMGMPLDTEILILEFGANKPGEIRELTDYFPPTLAVLTAIEPVHLEGFKTLSGVLREKLEITNSPLIESIVYNNDNALLSEHFKYVVKSMGVGEWKDSDFVISLDNSEYNLPAMSFVLAHRPTQEVARFTANVWGRHNVMPLALAASVGHELGIRLQDSSDALKDFEALSGRGRIIFPEENKFIVDDAYNANPASMKASLETFSRVQTSGKIAVLGDMLELGEDKIYFHKELEPLLDGLDKVILVGSLWREALQDNERYIFVPDWQGGLNELRNLMNNLDWHGILIKASQSVGLSNIVKEITA